MTIDYERLFAFYLGLISIMKWTHRIDSSILSVTACLIKDTNCVPAKRIECSIFFNGLISTGTTSNN